METLSILVYLRKIIPDIDLIDDNIQNVIKSDLDYETKVIKILSKFFKKKKDQYINHLYNEILVVEANDLQKLFPSKSFQYLYDQLEIFKDMPNRKEIVLRQIVYSKAPRITTNGLTSPNGKNTVKRGSQGFGSIIYNEPNPKVLKLEDHPSFNVSVASSVSSTITNQELNYSKKSLDYDSPLRIIQRPTLVYENNLKTETVIPTNSSLKVNSIPTTNDLLLPPKSTTIDCKITSSNSSQGAIIPTTSNMFSFPIVPNSTSTVTSNTIQQSNSLPANDLFSLRTSSNSTCTVTSSHNAKIEQSINYTEIEPQTVASDTSCSSSDKILDYFNIYDHTYKRPNLTENFNENAFFEHYSLPFQFNSDLSLEKEMKSEITPIDLVVHKSCNVSSFDKVKPAPNETVNTNEGDDLIDSKQSKKENPKKQYLSEVQSSSDSQIKMSINVKEEIAKIDSIIKLKREEGNSDVPKKMLRVRRLSELNNENQTFNFQSSPKLKKQSSLDASFHLESKERNSQSTSSSNTQEYTYNIKMEISSPDIQFVDESAIPETSNSTVDLLTPVVMSEVEVETSHILDGVDENLVVPKEKQHSLKNFPVCSSTTGQSNRASNIRDGIDRHVASNTCRLKQPIHSNQNPDDIKFNLIKYVHEITTVPAQKIEKHCKILRLSRKKKPPNEVLNLLIDSIFDDNSNISESEEGHLPWSDDDITNTKNIPSEEASSTVKLEKLNTKKEQRTVIEDAQLVSSLCSIFPDACPTYIKRLCKGKKMDNEVLDDLVTTILNTDNTYPKRPKPTPEPEVVPENQLEILQEFLPDADPDYLRMMCDKFDGKADLVKTFLNEAMEKRNYPTMKDYQRRQQLSAQQKQYTTDFTVENFMKVIPDPPAFFSDPSRNIKLDATSAHYALIFLRNKFNRLPVRVIQSVFTKNASKISDTINELKYASTQSNLIMRSVRKPIDLPKNIQNIPLLQEIAYYSHENEIIKYMKQMKNREKAERLEAKNKGLLKTCNCCYDEEVLPRDIFCCENGCEFCKSCLVKSAEVTFGEGKLDFPCLMNCDSFFSLQTLQAVLPPKLFSKIAQKKSLEEVKSAAIEGLEFCPFCDFATIPAEGYNIFTCMNPECMKESCRMCKEPSHIPLRCDEIEKDEDVRARTFVENKMTEALLRKCWRCGVKFFKEEGCNKMTCSCGAQMCYVCGQPVTNYQHFNGNGGDRYDLCPLYSDSNVLNKENVLRGAEQAKAEIGNMALKHDPTADVNKYYEERSKKNPQAHLLVGQQPMIQVVQNMRMHVGAAFGHVRPVVLQEQHRIVPIEPQDIPRNNNI